MTTLKQPLKGFSRLRGRWTMAGAITGVVLVVSAQAAIAHHDARRTSSAMILRVSGHLNGATTPPFAAAETERLAIVLDSEATVTCEDLGRQLREMLRAKAMQKRHTIVVTRRGDSSRVAIWLSRERIDQVGVIATTSDSLWVGNTHVIAPAVLLMDGPATVRQGVVHPIRVPNMRPISFASELGIR